MLTRFLKVGVVTAEPRPPSVVYRINREHALWPVTKLALSTRSGVFENIGRFCAEEIPQQLGLTVVVYGSVARRAFTLTSDVDLFVVHPDGVDADGTVSNGIDADTRADLNFRISPHVERLTGNAAHVFSVVRSELVQRISEGDPLVVNVLTEGILLHGRSHASDAQERAS